jgi:hypothetical protein
MHLSETLAEIDTRYPNLADYIAKIPDNSFSEFNVMGAVAERYLGDQYHIQSTETEPLPTKYCEQYWSWGGMTNELKEALQCVCK